MTPQELMNSILQLAIQGKLVEQRSEEGTAEELYRQIQAEKQKLIETGKIKKEKPLPEITEDEKPFDIPESWKWVRLGTLLRVIGGVSYDKKDVTTSGYRILRGGNIQQMRVLLEEDDVFLPEQYKDEDKLIRKGDILIVASTGSKAVIGKAGYVDRPIEDTMIGAFLRICRPFLFSTVNYLRCLFDSEFYRKHIRELSQGTNINNVKESYITGFAIPLPSLSEQTRIVAKIEELMPLVNRYEQAWTKLEDFNKRFPVDMQKSILQMAVQGKLVKQNTDEGTGQGLLESIKREKEALIKQKIIGKGKRVTPIPEEDLPFDVPDNWCWIRLGEILTSTDAGKSPQCENRPRRGREWGVIKTTAVQDGYFLPDENKVLPDNFPVQESQIVHKDDFLITRAGPKNRTGIMCVVEEEPENIILSDKTVRLSYLKGFVNPRYLQYALSSPAMQRWVVDSMTGMAASQVNISQDKMWAFVLPLPPKREQDRIVKRLEEILPLCNRLK